jgi:hypothetical protein
MRRYRNLTAMINRERTKIVGHGQKALKIEETEVPEILKVTYKGKNFFMENMEI